MKKISLAALAISCASTAFADAAPRYDEFLAIIRDNGCSITWQEMQVVFLEGAGFEVEQVQDLAGYAIENGAATLENNRSEPDNDKLVLSKAACKG
ncbi:hypothetical protein J7413_00335 [Shimia sp. R10_1]|uniref:hypothetical protein n=1 Tax=Shimia sp. R10_1 TaxID=2821095 RepID=UPI001AD96B43|nr:hypothetical protein [Shimia sp. R10_1]MBO9471973.1 hypothetical protein [Shimia sp. R10_1]